MAIVGIALHGICNDFVLILGAMYIAEIAPIGAKAQAQSLFVFLTSGLGTFIGSLVRGEIFNGVVAAHPRTGPELLDRASVLPDRSALLVHPVTHAFP